MGHGTWNKDMGQEKEYIARGLESQPDTVCSLIIFSYQPPKEEGRLG
jgi:hypothetical protein